MATGEQPKLTGIRDRIIDFRRVRAGDLMPDERNWRRHPKQQQEALAGVLREIGYADALLVRETPDGLKLIDGHLRAGTTPDMAVPVLVTDLDEAESAKLLATLDPLSAMAETDAAALDALLREVDTGGDALAQMLADLAESVEGTQLREAGETATRNLKSPNVVKMIVRCADVSVIEQAIRATGEHNRGAALVALCAAYLANHPLRDVV